MAGHYLRRDKQLCSREHLDEGPAAANLIDSTLSSGEKGGYKFTLSANSGGYIINAAPVAFGVSGSRTFYSDQSMVVRQNFGQEPATVNSPEIK